MSSALEYLEFNYKTNPLPDAAEYRMLTKLREEEAQRQVEKASLANQVAQCTCGAFTHNMELRDTTTAKVYDLETLMQDKELLAAVHHVEWMKTNRKPSVFSSENEQMIACDKSPNSRFAQLQKYLYSN